MSWYRSNFSSAATRFLHRVGLHVILDHQGIDAPDVVRCQALQNFQFRAFAIDFAEAHALDLVLAEMVGQADAGHVGHLFMVPGFRK